jgi:cobalt/nickel transport system ATP-binding protein
MNAHVTIKNLSFAYPDGFQALQDISLSVADGERVALVGPNGAGKTTLLLHLNGILRGQGSIKVGAEFLDDKTIMSIRRRVGLIFQDPNDQLFCPTVEEDIAFGPLHFEFNNQEIQELVKSSLKQVDMEGMEKRLTHHLSFGERKRISIACVLSCNPEILAFDEPSASLDPKHRRELIEFIQKTDKTVLIATHDLDLALKTCSRCIIMNGGKIVANGDIEEFFRDDALLRQNDLELPMIKMGF